MRLPHCILRLIIGPVAVVGTAAQSNFDLDHSVITAESIGAVAWTVPGNGAVINQYYASGNIYGSNIGWISLGATPADKSKYRNNSALDYGVNVAADGALRGYAYGANVGWISFEATGNPRVDWVSGRLSGRVWSANLGWLNLENSTEFLRLESMPEPADSDSDGIADAWEIFHASNLTSLSAESDADSDGQRDIDEYLAGTDPFDAVDSLLVRVQTSTTGPTLQWPTKSGYVYFVDQRADFRTSVAWSAASAKIVGNGSTATLTIPFGNQHNFYRVRAYPPLSTP